MQPSWLTSQHEHRTDGTVPPVWEVMATSGENRPGEEREIRCAPADGPGLGVQLDWEAVRAHEQLPYRKTYQPSLWHVDGSVADW